MVRLPQALEAKRIKLLALARRKAFESYLRYGRVTALHEQAAAFAVGAEKALGPETGIPAAAPPRLKPTAYYTWRTAGDERVRAGYAAHAGQVFAWANPPDGGHPGTAPNCRCWAEPYYGNPDVPDALLKVTRERQIDSTGRERWASIETLRRPDGSLVESAMLGRHGASIHSSFAGSTVSHVVTPAEGQPITVEKRNGVQRMYAGDDRSLLLETTWGTNGLQMRAPRVHVAHADETVWQSPSGISVLSTPKLYPLAALVLLYEALQAKPDSLGLGSTDVPVMAFKVWTDEQSQNAGIAVEALTFEQVSQVCTRLPEVQAWTDAAATKYALIRSDMTEQAWGMLIHKEVETTIKTLKAEFPGEYDDLSAELSLDALGAVVSYGKRGSSRLDVAEDRRKDTGSMCIYDVKTGNEGLTARRVGQLYTVSVQKYGAAIFYIIEIRPFN